MRLGGESPRLGRNGKGLLLLDLQRFPPVLFFSPGL